MDIICAIDLDTILPCLFISRLKKIRRIYDAHELFTELKEVVIRPGIKAKWIRIEKYAVPKFKWGYTVSESIAKEFHRRYNVNYNVILNVPVLKAINPIAANKEFIFYQGAVNEARGFEYLIPAMKNINSKLIVCGDGNFMDKLKELIKQNSVEDKVELKRMLLPHELWEISLHARVGITIIENTGMNQYYSLPNKFFDYIHAEVPQVAVNYPEYKKINERFEVAILLDQIKPEIIASAINNLLSDDVLYERLRKNCILAKQELNWQNEESKLINFYKKIIN